MEKLREKKIRGIVAQLPEGRDRVGIRSHPGRAGAKAQWKVKTALLLDRAIKGVPAQASTYNCTLSCK